MAATYFGISKVETFSGGTEATAFHPNAEARRGVSTPAGRKDCGLVVPHCPAVHMRRSVSGCGAGAGNVR